MRYPSTRAPLCSMAATISANCDTSETLGHNRWLRVGATGGYGGCHRSGLRFGHGVPTATEHPDVTGRSGGPAAVSAIQTAAQHDCGVFAARMAETSLEAAVDTWLKRVARRKVSAVTRARMVKAVERAAAPQTRDVQLLRAALLRAAGLDERAAAAAAVAAGATYAEVGEVLGMSQQGARKRVMSSSLHYNGGRS